MDQTANEGNDVALTEQDASLVEQAKPQTLEEIRRARVEKLSPKPVEEESTKTDEEPEEVEEVSQEDAETAEPEESPSVEEESNETQESEDSEGVLSQIDWDELNDDVRSQIAIQAMELLPSDKLGDLAKKMGSGSGKRIGELTSQIKQLKSELEAKESALSEGLDSIVSPSNSLSSYTSEEDLSKVEKETRNNIRFYQNWLAGDDDSFEAGGQTYTRQDVASYLSGLQDKYDDIPKQRKYISKLNSALKEAEELSSKFSDEFDWIEDDESETFKGYQEMVSSSDMAIVQKIAPALAAKLKYQLAHAASSIYKPKVQRRKKIVLPKKLPKNAISGNASSNSRKTEQSTKIKKLREAARKGNLLAARQLRQIEINNRFK